MQLLQAWKNSLTIFAPHNIKLFMLVTLNAIMITYRTLFTYCWPLLLIAGMSSIGLHMGWHASNALFIMHGIVWGAVVYAMYLAVRPSMMRKDYWYFLSYAFCFGYFIFIFASICWLSFVAFMIQNLPIGSTVLHSIFSGFYWLVGPTYVYSADELLGALFSVNAGPFFVFLILFMLDTNGKVYCMPQTIIRTAKMVIYNLPFCVLAMLSFMMLFGFGHTTIIFPGLLRMVVGLILSGIGYVVPISPLVYEHSMYHILLFALPIPLCFFTNFYIKKIHEQSELYIYQP